MRIVSETMSVEQNDGVKTVKVVLDGPTVAPKITWENRARARAIVSAGAVPTIEDALNNITKGELDRITTIKNVRSSPVKKGHRFLLTHRRIITVDVVSD